MKRMFWAAAVMAMLLGACSTTQTLSESGQKFSYRSDSPIAAGKTTKKQVIDAYGQPTSSAIKGRYEILLYSYSRDTIKQKGIGSSILRAVPGIGEALLLNDLVTDHGKAAIENSATEWQTLQFYIELSTGIVRDYYYHDSELNGNDESETLYLESRAAFRQKKNDEAVNMLEKAVLSNPNNHRALNSLAWHYIDLGIDIDKGISYAQKAVSVFPDSPYNNGTLGIGYFKKGDTENSEKYLKTAVDLFPVYAPNDVKSLQHDTAMLQTVREKKKIQ